MKFLVLIMAVAACQAKPVDKVREFCLKNGATTNLYQADPEDLNQYYMCQWLGDRYLQGFRMSCAAGLVWQQSITACNYPKEPVQEPASEKSELKEEKSEEYEKGKTYECMQGDIKFVMLNTKMFKRISADGTETKEYCPEETPYFSYRRCACYNPKDPVQEPASEKSETKDDKSEEYEKGKTYECMQGDYKFVVVNTKTFKRISPDGNEIQQYCPAKAPYFSYRRCTCYNKNEDPTVPNRRVPAGTVLKAKECFINGNIRMKTGRNTYTSRTTVPTAVQLPTLPATTECPVDRLAFSLTECACVAATADDFLADNQCIRDMNIYEKVDENTYKVANKDKRDFGAAASRCPPSMPFFDVVGCFCAADPAAQPAPTPDRSCAAFLFSKDVADSSSLAGVVKRKGDEEAAYFDGTNSIKPNVLLNNEFGSKFTMAFRFKYEKYGQMEKKTLVSDGGSLEVSASDGEVTVKVKVNTNGDMCEISGSKWQIVPRIFPAPPPKYDAILIQYDGLAASQNLRLRINSKSYFADCKGSVPSTGKHTTFGTDFVGYIDDLYICTTSIKDPQSVVTHFGL